jgi:hypothetical protein
MSYALNEVEAMAKKAVRGAGLSWGLAEDAAKATRWLCEFGLDGVGALAAALNEPNLSDGPLVQGVGVSDGAARLLDAPMRFGAVSSPMLLLPFAAMAARQLGRTVTVECDGQSATTDGVALSMSAPLSGASAVTVRIGGTLEAPCATHTRANPASQDWETLSTFAHRTYAPATEASRLLGAGAGLSDND